MKKGQKIAQIVFSKKTEVVLEQPTLLAMILIEVVAVLVVLGLFSMTDENYKNLASSIVLLAIDDVVRCTQGKRPIGLNYKDIDLEEIIQEKL